MAHVVLLPSTERLVTESCTPPATPTIESRIHANRNTRASHLNTGYWNPLVAFLNPPNHISSVHLHLLVLCGVFVDDNSPLKRAEMFSFKACLQLSLLVASVLLKPANAECECGYSVDGQIFTNKIGYDFSEYPNTSGTKLAEENTLSDWVIQSWGVPETINRAYSNETSDEVLLPRLNQHENVWIEDGSLVLRQIGYTKEDEKNGNPVRVAELVSKRVDIKYGTFRARYRVETEPGATGGGVSGFFYYFVSSRISKRCVGKLREV